ncbi:uncharacterized protein LOC144492405 isoform X2 [Mustelus asterias]
MCPMQRSVDLGQDFPALGQPGPWFKRRRPPAMRHHLDIVMLTSINILIMKWSLKHFTQRFPVVCFGEDALEGSWVKWIC